MRHPADKAIISEHYLLHVMSPELDFVMCSFFAWEEILEAICEEDLVNQKYTKCYTLPVVISPPQLKNKSLN